MATLVLDTNIVSYFMKGGPLAEVYRARLIGHRLAMSFQTVAELFEGAERKRWGEKRRQQLEATLRQYLVIPSSLSIARAWGLIRWQRRHRTISPEDAWIAATALAHACPLVTHDARGFADIEDLSIVTEYR